VQAEASVHRTVRSGLLRERYARTPPPFTIPGSDAAWDDKTNTLTWTPTMLDIGKVTPVFNVSDGRSAKALKVKLTVVNPLPFEADKEP
jgi:hypothetical protein